MAKKKAREVVANQWEKSLEDFFLKKLPSLPKSLKEIIVKYGPWVVLVSMVFCLRGALATMGIWRTFRSVGYMGYRYYYGFGAAWLVSLVSMGLVLWALPGLFRRKILSWRLMLYSSLIMGVYYLITMSLGSLIIGVGLSFYVLFQIKSYYK
jgi:hypothetical protein